MLSASEISKLYLKYNSMRYIYDQAKIGAGSCSPVILGQAGAMGISREDRDAINAQVFQAMYRYTQQEMSRIEGILEENGIPIELPSVKG